MGMTREKAVWLYLIGACLTGCATARVQSLALSDLQAAETLSALRSVCQDLKLGEEVTLTLRLSEVPPGVPAEQRTGYFYAYNRLNDTVYIADKSLGAFDRGEPYELGSIDSIIPTAAPAPAIAKLESAKNVPLISMISGDSDTDYERELLTK
jgi:hypothetical protein